MRVLYVFESPVCISRQFWNLHCVGNLHGFVAHAMGVWMMSFPMCSPCGLSRVMIDVEGGLSLIGQNVAPGSSVIGQCQKCV